MRDGATGEILAERAGFIGVATNNVAEYRGLIAGLRAARTLDPSAAVDVRLDSELLVRQMKGEWKIKHPEMRRLALIARDVAQGANVTFAWRPRAQNTDADALANEAMDSESMRIRRGFDADGRDQEDDDGLF